MRAAPDHQFPLAALVRVTDQRVRFEHTDGRDNLMYPRHGVLDLMLIEMIEVIEDPVEVLSNLGRQFDA